MMKKTYPTVFQSFSGSMAGNMKTGNTIFKLKRASHIPSKFSPSRLLSRLWAQCKRLQPGRKHPACDATARTKVKDFGHFSPKKTCWAHVSHVQPVRKLMLDNGRISAMCIDAFYIYVL